MLALAMRNRLIINCLYTQTLITIESLTGLSLVFILLNSLNKVVQSRFRMTTKFLFHGLFLLLKLRNLRTRMEMLPNLLSGGTIPRNLDGAEDNVSVEQSIEMLFLLIVVFALTLEVTTDVPCI